MVIHKCILTGTFAVISILVSKPTIEFCSGTDSMNPLNATFLNQTSLADDVIRCEMKVAVAVTFLSGIIQVMLENLRLQFELLFI